MKNKKTHIPEIHPLEKEFRNLRKADFQAYEEWYDHKKKMFFTPDPALEEKAQAVEEDVLREAGIDLDRLKEIDAAQWEEAQVHLKEKRQVLINEKSDLDQLARERLAWISRNNQIGAQTIPMIGADHIQFKPLPAPPNWGDQVTDADAHEWGNSVWFQPEGQTELKAKHQCRHINCLAAIGGSHDRVEFSFLFDNPKVSGNYWIQCTLPYNGFFALHAYRKWWNCREAHVKAESFLKIHQGLWQAERKQTVVNVGGQHIHHVSNVSGQVFFDFHQFLLKDIPVMIKLSFEIAAWTRYTSTYAEINFEDGPANFIGAPVLMVAI